MNYRGHTYQYWLVQLSSWIKIAIILGSWAVLGLLIGLLLSGCHGVLQDPPADMEANMRPPIVEQPLPPPPPRPTLDLSQAKRRAWVPRQTAPNGDTTEGHYVEIGTKDVEEVVQPVRHIPRAPKHTVAPITQPKIRTPQQNPLAEALPATPSLPLPAAVQQPVHPLLGGTTTP